MRKPGGAERQARSGLYLVYDRGSQERELAAVAVSLRRLQGLGVGLQRA